MINYPYLEDKKFLKELDLERLKNQYVRISVLDFKTEMPLINIEGKATGGTVNLNGTSNMRRAGSCSLVVDEYGIRRQDGAYIDYRNITEIQNIISLNKKISLEVGYDNALRYLGEEYYSNYDIIWIPLGIFTIKAGNAAKSGNGVNISLTLNDKTACLNGDIGGTIPAGTVFSELETISQDGFTRTVEKLLIKDIIKYLVVDFGGENPENVIIEDIPDKIRRVLKWSGDYNIYLIKDENGNQFISETNELDNVKIEECTTYSFGMDIGYSIEPFTYPGTLEANAGENVASILDKLKNTLGGNFEWFYDVFGRFHFQEKKNYLNTSAATNMNELTEESYLSISNPSKSIYDFTSKELVTNISSSPQYANIKNDFTIWGAAKTVTGADKPIRYHLVFDTKPIPSGQRLGFIYKDYTGLTQATILKNDVNCKYENPLSIENPTEEDKRYYYIVENNTIRRLAISAWDEETGGFRVFEDWEVCYLRAFDWRTELYYLCLENKEKPFSKNYYAAELIGEWPKIYNIADHFVEYQKYEDKDIYIPLYYGAYKKDKDQTEYEYFIDFIEGSQGGSVNLSQFNVSNIGRRTKISNDKSANCIFAHEIPNFIIEKVGEDTIEDKDSDLPVIKVNEKIFSKIVTGGTQSSAIDVAKNLLVQHTNYNESINLTTIPIYYLEPNTRITINDNDTGVHGDYFVNTISLPLTFGTSTIACTKCIEKTI